MKKEIVFIFTLILLTGVLFAAQEGENQSITSPNSQINKTNEMEKNQMREGNQIKIQEREKERIKAIIKKQNRIMAENLNQSECPENCTCSGSVTKCGLKGNRTMTILAGKSGNTIIQVKGENMSTKVNLYKADGKIYGVLKENQTKVIKMLPDQVKEKIQRKLQQRNESQNITLDEEGKYQVETQKKARLFFLFPVKEKVKIEVNSETGEITKTKTSWWAFLARDSKDKELLGESCGTVTPGYNDECCQNKGYDYWDATQSECLFTPEEQIQEELSL